MYLEKTSPHSNLLVTTDIFNGVIRGGPAKTISWFPSMSQACVTTTSLWPRGRGNDGQTGELTVITKKKKKKNGTGAHKTGAFDSREAATIGKYSWLLEVTPYHEKIERGRHVRGRRNDGPQTAVNQVPAAILTFFWSMDSAAFTIPSKHFPMIGITCRSTSAYVFIDSPILTILLSSISCIFCNVRCCIKLIRSTIVWRTLVYGGIVNSKKLSRRETGL